MTGIVETEWALMLPAFEHVFYGRPVASYAEDFGFIVAGHDRRSYAAVNRAVKVAIAEYDGSHAGRNRHVPIKVGWYVIHQTCGCTDAEHALHGAPIPEELEDATDEALDPYRDCYEACREERSGLPPCGDEYSWMVEHATESTPGVVPVLEVTW